MRVLLLSSLWPPNVLGGAELHAAALADRLADAAAVVLSLLARAGAAGDDLVAADAFTRGAAALGPTMRMQLRPAAACTTAALDAAVDALADVSPLGKRNLLAACAMAAAADAALSSDETDLLRALAAIWDLPVPLAVAT